MPRGDEEVLMNSGGYTATLLQNAVLAIANMRRNYLLNACSRRLVGLIAGPLLMFGASGFAEAAPLQLTCESSPDVPGHYYRSTVKLRVDLDRGIVELLQSSGYVMASTTDKKMNALAPAVRVIDSAIQWRLSNSIGFIFKGEIDRETGDSTVDWHMPRGTYAGADEAIFFFKGRCRRATQKF